MVFEPMENEMSPIATSERRPPVPAGITPRVVYAPRSLGHGAGTAETAGSRPVTSLLLNI